ncbi:fasciclin domain-containing protein [Alterisphingorhabdus coralli]|uniref:Fasciclin domain-containing protein n=1 Tax=Alterisphingorhabdus coralli TaxID=3071408 RepID=A0AA97F4J8_9SPHN|nr:fasciclin domain-containing protein [Parasphingorhabdus sp. SCSIO 66989]WOE74204.1 fasciclin domain-containing protein [Parasphingorhabdus sp. SCSIO 66989]
MFKTSLTGLTVAALMTAGAAFAQESEAPAAAQAAAPTEAPAPALVPAPSPHIVDAAVGSEDFSTLVGLVQAAELVETLSSTGPFTVFAPTNDAFGVFPEGAVDGLKQPGNKAILTRILTYHVVPGKITSAELIAMIEAGGGSVKIKTVEGTELTATIEADQVKLTGTNGNAFVTKADLEQSNGIIHAINGVVVP